MSMQDAWSKAIDIILAQEAEKARLARLVETSQYFCVVFVLWTLQQFGLLLFLYTTRFQKENPIPLVSRKTLPHVEILG